MEVMPSVEERVKSLGIAQKVGQLFMVGFEGQTLETAGGMVELIATHHVGGAILLGRNVVSPPQVAGLCNALQGQALTRGSRLPLLIAIDQEGGAVSRLPLPFTQFPAPAVVGQTASPDLARRLGMAMAAELRAVGITMNLAPVVDCLTNPHNPVIAGRAFGSYPELVARLGQGCIVGLQGGPGGETASGGVAAVAKHFPGHGDSDRDSHRELPVIAHAPERLRRIELHPFATAIQSGVAGIMLAHVLYTALDPLYPASLSPRIIQGLLRQEMGFQGLTMSDDLCMQAITSHYGLAEACIQALRAGADLLLLCHDLTSQAGVIAEVVRRVEAQAVAIARIDEAVGRIIQVKRRFVLPDPIVPVAEEMAAIGCLAHRQLVALIEQTAQRRGPPAA